MTKPTEPMSLREKLDNKGVSITATTHDQYAQRYTVVGQLTDDSKQQIMALLTAELETLKSKVEQYCKLHDTPASKHFDDVSAIPVTALDALIERVKTR
jgi:ClpP class serine protease